ncbi:MAG: endopeptidase La [Desulfovibrio sp.]
MSDFVFDEQDSQPEKLSLPMMSLREVVMFPRSIVPLFVGRDASIEAIEKAVEFHDKKIFLVTQKDPETEKPATEDHYQIGTVSKILQMLRLPDGTIKVLFEGLQRGVWEEDKSTFVLDQKFPMALVEPWYERSEDSTRSRATVRLVGELLDQFGAANPKIQQEALSAIAAIKDAGKLADSIMPHLRCEFTKKQEVLEEHDPVARLERVYELMHGEIEISQIEKRVKGRVKDQMEKNQREYYLNEQVKAINKEMGREDDPQAEAIELEEKINAKDMSQECRDRVVKEIKKLRFMTPSSAEYTVLRNYVDWVLELPWNSLKDAKIDLDNARAVLDNDHFGLEKPKERILEYLAVQTLVETLKGPILCLVGPPGVGKTSIARSISRAMNREFVRLSLGGVRDEAEIRGHRRTYVGAMPGKLLQSLRRCEFNNPVICLDEVDKMSADFRGDPSSALLEVLDPEQNYAFNDHYLDLDYDLSKVFFITTANSLESIPLPLQDRMEIIRLPGYLETEKLTIAKDFLLPKQREVHGLKEKNVEIDDDAFREVIQHYTREAGVRNLEREIAGLCRKSAMKLVESGEMEETVSIDEEVVKEFLGVPKYTHGEREDSPLVGVTNGLAWTQMGGELLMVEVALMPGKGKVEITGKLGDVMQESARAAFSYLRSRSDRFGLKDDFYQEVDVHVHVPEGATPKDGPSAGVTLVTSLASALLNVPVRDDVAMTGEITLRGRVLPIGGLREKLLAAMRAGIKTVLIPAGNEKDLKDVPEDILNALEVFPVKNMDEVLEKALLCADMKPVLCGRGEEAEPIANSLTKESVQTRIN